MAEPIYSFAAGENWRAPTYEYGVAPIPPIGVDPYIWQGVWEAQERARRQQKPVPTTEEFRKPESELPPETLNRIYTNIPVKTIESEKQYGGSPPVTQVEAAPVTKTHVMPQMRTQQGTYSLTQEETEKVMTSRHQGYDPFEAKKTPSRFLVVPQELEYVIGVGFYSGAQKITRGQLSGKPEMTTEGAVTLGLESAFTVLPVARIGSPIKFASIPLETTVGKATRHQILLNLHFPMVL